MMKRVITKMHKPLLRFETEDDQVRMHDKMG